VLVAILHADLILRLRSAKGHQRGNSRMVESDAGCLDILHQVCAGQSAVQEINRIVIDHHLYNSLRGGLGHSEPGVRERAMMSAIALCKFAGAAAPLTNGKEMV
jgi:DNA-binding FrmR family transcriptional regulator